MMQSTTDPMYAIRPLAEGKLVCECGNSDWLEFLYVLVEPVVVAGCKECGHQTYRLKDGVWKKL